MTFDTRQRTHHPDGSIPPLDWIFVFGSNLAGRHGRGAARVALMKFGAIYGEGIGRHGNSYAIPTKGRHLATLPLQTIRTHIRQFIEHAHAHPNDRFFVTRIGCGLAGHADLDVAPMFKGAPENCSFAFEWVGLCL